MNFSTWVEGVENRLCVEMGGYVFWDQGEVILSEAKIVTKVQG